MLFEQGPLDAAHANPEAGLESLGAERGQQRLVVAICREGMLGLLDPAPSVVESGLRLVRGSADQRKEQPFDERLYRWRPDACGCGTTTGRGFRPAGISPRARTARLTPCRGREHPP